MEQEADLQELLFRSVSNNDIAGVDRVLGLGAKIDLGMDGNNGSPPPLLMATKMGNLKMVEHLLARGAQINMTLRQVEWSPLMDATLAGNTGIIKALIKAGAYKIFPKTAGLRLCDCAKSTERNAKEVWEVLLDPATGLPPEQYPSDPNHGDVLLLHAAREAVYNIDMDPASVATLLHHGANWRGYSALAGDTMLHDLSYHENMPKHLNEEQLEAYHARMEKIIASVLKEGVSPFLLGTDGTYGYEAAAQAYPALTPLLRDIGKPLAERLEKFSPARDPLLGDDKKPTDLLIYCACENRLGEALAVQHWPNPLELMKLKHALKEALSPYYKDKLSADLDTTAQRRSSATDGVLSRLIDPTQRGR